MLVTHCSKIYPVAHIPFAPIFVLPVVVSFPCSFPYIVETKFGDLATLDALVDQHRAQGGTFNPRLSTDGSLSKAKIHWWLMAQKVMDRIAELGEQHLKLVVMHDFLWALIEEQASDRAHQHWEKNQDSGQDILQVEAEAHSISQGVVT